jgi:hypothetical protein
MHYISTMTTTIRFTAYTDDDGEEGEVELSLPAKFEVCPGCNGHGSRLCEGMRGHAYTAEEFHESFDDEEAEEYFRPGGRYDVMCEECQGKRVVAVADEDACRTPEQKEALALYYKKRDDDYAYDRECAAERRMGC